MRLFACMSTWSIVICLPFTIRAYDEQYIHDSWNCSKYYSKYKGFRTLQRFSQPFFEKSVCKNRCPFKKLLKKSFQLWQDVVACGGLMHLFAVSVVVCERLKKIKVEHFYLTITRHWTSNTIIIHLATLRCSPMSFGCSQRLTYNIIGKSIW